MMEEEEDILFDRAGLLTNRVKPAREVRVPVNKRRVIKTLLLCTAFFGLGLCMSIPGPTLLDLQARTNTSTEEMSRIFTARSIGYLSGSIVGGLSFDRINQDCLLSFALFLTAIGTAAAPWSTSYVILMVVISFQGVSMGILDTGGNVLCLQTWGRQSGPYMQAMHFAFGLGAFVAPLVAEPFLSPLGSNGTTLMVPVESTTISDVPVPMNRRHARDADTSTVLPTPHDMTNILLPLANSKSNQSLAANKSKKPITHGSGSDADGGLMGKKLQNNQQADSAASREEQVEKPGDDADSEMPSVAENCNKTNNITECQPPTVVSTTLHTTSSTTLAPTTTTTSTTTSKSLHKNFSEKAITNNSVIPPSLVPTSSANVTNNTGTVTTIIKHVKQAIHMINDLTKVQFAYVTIALFVFVVSVLYTCICCCAGSRNVRAMHSLEDMEYVIHREGKGFRIQVLILLFFFYFLYVGMEITYGNLVMTFSVKYLGWSKPRGTMLTSLFWGSFATGRGLAIFFARCLSPALMLIADIIMTCLSLAGLVLVLESNHQMMWFCTATLGAGMASIFPTGITWAERYMHISGKATAVFVVGSALGEMSMPAMTGYLFDTKGPIWLLYIMLGAGLLTGALYIIMQNLASNSGERYHRLSNPGHHMESDGTMEDEDDMEDDCDSVEMSTVLVASSSTSSSLSNGTSTSRKKVTFKLPNESSVTNSSSPKNASKSKNGINLLRNKDTQKKD